MSEGVGKVGRGLLPVVVVAALMLSACGTRPPSRVLSVTVQWNPNTASQSGLVRGGWVCVGQGSNEQCANTDSNGVANINVTSMPPGYYILLVGADQSARSAPCTTCAGAHCGVSEHPCYQVEIPTSGSPAPLIDYITDDGTNYVLTT